MKQLLQVLGSGEVRVLDVPEPVLRPGGVLVRTHASVVSVGTDRTQIEFGRKSLLAKARERPEQARQVLRSMARDGVRATRERVRRKLDSYVALGYSTAGVVEAVGAGVTDLEAGQHVACAGAGYASHAEQVWVPNNLVVPVPDEVRFEHAAFATMGSIALHGVRQGDVRMGETVAVLGMGLLGQLTVQLLKAAGARAIAIDLDAERVRLAEEFGALGLRRSDAVEQHIAQATDGRGVDVVLVTAGTSSEDPILLAGRIARDRGRIVVVGLVPTNLPRSPWFEKELELRISRSYGPGRYDRNYEEKGQDYPIGYVRWTERRNLEEFVRLVAAGAVRLDPLITHRFPLDEAPSAYAAMQGGGSPLGVVIDYPAAATFMAPAARILVASGGERRLPVKGGAGVGFIGAGSFAADVLLPALGRMNVPLVGVATARGVSARQAGEQFGFRYLASDPQALLEDPEIGAIFIATRHDEHASLTARALEAGKAVFVEKPLAIDRMSLAAVLSAAKHARPLLVGFNRRFAPATLFVQQRLARLPGARMVQIRVNAGALPSGDWLHDPAVGGGRIIGEGCHFIDLAIALVGARVTTVHAVPLAGADPAARLRDNVQITLGFADGSVAGIMYTAKGNAAAGKERVEVFAAGATAIIDDFRAAEFHGGKVERWKGRQDKGHAEQLRQFMAAVRSGGPSPVDLGALAESSEVTLRAAEAIAGAAASG
jgi:predicted dehydrogenase/threonine dehydrogenase-like Zn-dependent dehydrogenase